MMQAADLRNRDHSTAFRPFDLAFNRRIPIKRQVRPRFVVITEIGGENTATVGFVEHDDVIQTLASNRADQAFHKRVLPR